MLWTYLLKGPRRLWFVLTNSGSDTTELFSSLVLIGTGGALLNPYADTFAASPRSFAGMASIADEWAWGAALLCIGLIQLWAVSGMHQRTRSRICLLSAMVFALLSVAQWLANPAGLGGYAYGPMALFQGRTFIWLWTRGHD